MPAWMCVHVSSYFRIQMMGFHEQVNTVTQKLCLLVTHLNQPLLLPLTIQLLAGKSIGKSLCFVGRSSTHGQFSIATVTDLVPEMTLDRWMAIPGGYLLKSGKVETWSFREGFPMDSMEISHLIVISMEIPFISWLFSTDFRMIFSKPNVRMITLGGYHCRPGCGSRSTRIGAMPRMRKRLRSSRCMVTG